MKVFAENRKARNSYEFSEYIEAGIVLTGAETKSIRNGAVSIVDAFAIIENEEAIIREMNIEHYKYSNELDYNAKSPRKLLLHKKEIKNVQENYHPKLLNKIGMQLKRMHKNLKKCLVKNSLRLQTMTI